MTYKVFIEKNKVLFLQFDEWINGIVRNGIVRNGLVKMKYLEMINIFILSQKYK